MNRRGFIKGAITVGLVASIIKGRDVEIKGYNELGRPMDLAHAVWVGNEDGTQKLYHNGRAFIETTPNGQRFDYTTLMNPERW